MTSCHWRWDDQLIAPWLRDVIMCLKQLPVAQLHACKHESVTALLPLRICCHAMKASIPSISSEIEAVLLTQARLDLQSNTVYHMSCQGGQAQRHQIRWPLAYTGAWLQFKATNASSWQQAQQTCNHTYQGLSVAMARGAPLKHFGHR